LVSLVMPFENGFCFLFWLLACIGREGVSQARGGQGKGGRAVRSLILLGIVIPR
jgi:hypothetical protein